MGHARRAQGQDRRHLGGKPRHRPWHRARLRARGRADRAGLVVRAESAAAAKAIAAEGPEPLTVAGDLRRLDACERLFNAVNDRFHRCDVLVSNAGATRAARSSISPTRLGSTATR
jgi:NAD(P)-dependent dehydrogenase (short-subunit alcohol dehydrogenase family)